MICCYGLWPWGSPWQVVSILFFIALGHKDYGVRNFEILFFMKSLQLLIKPASSLCDLKCKYCFYHDLATHQALSPKIMSPQTLELTIKRASEYFANAPKEEPSYLSILFQGGEPTLAGLDYFKQAIAFQKHYFAHLPQVQISNAIQTNGCKLDDDLVSFLVANDFFFGISLDGPKALHDAMRIHRNGSGSYDEVRAGITKLQKFGAQFNVLCVLTDLNALNIKSVYEHFKELGFYNHQYIACLDPFERLGQHSKEHQLFLSEQAYSQFLINIFDLWYQDLMERGTYISIRHIENYLALLLNMSINSCNMTGVCQIQNVVESSGKIYPCDFYAHDDYELGNLTDHDFEYLQTNSKARTFIEQSYQLPDSCKTCSYLSLCRNGCYRERLNGKNIHCAAFKAFFAARLDKLKQAAAHLARMNS